MPTTCERHAEAGNVVIVDRQLGDGSDAAVGGGIARLTDGDAGHGAQNRTVRLMEGRWVEA